MVNIIILEIYIKFLCLLCKNLRAKSFSALEWITKNIRNILLHGSFHKQKPILSFLRRKVNVLTIQFARLFFCLLRFVNFFILLHREYSLKWKQRIQIFLSNKYLNLEDILEDIYHIIYLILRVWNSTLYSKKDIEKQR